MLIKLNASKTTLCNDGTAKGWAAAAKISNVEERFWHGNVFSGPSNPKAFHCLIHGLVAITLIWK